MHPGTQNEMKQLTDPRLDVLEHIKIPFWLFDVENLNIVWANQQGLRFWCANTFEEISRRDFSKDISVTVKNHLLQVKRDCIETGQSVCENWTLYPNNIPQNGEVVLSPFIFDDGESALLIHLVLERKYETSDTLRSAQALMHTSAMISLYDEDHNLLYSNPSARAISSTTNERLDDKIVHSNDLHEIAMMLNSVGACDKEILVNTPRGNVWHSTNFQKSMDPVTGKHAILCSSIDISDRKKAQQEAYTLAHTDALTGLPNRMALFEHLNRLCVDANHDFGLLFLDLDRFKIVNDSLGHTIGDMLLKEVGNRLKHFIRSHSGLVSRLGGDEFVIIIQDSGDKVYMHQVLNDVLDVLGKDVSIEGYNIPLTPSIGVCLYPADGDNSTTLMQHADVAMYSAKAAQMGYQFFEPSMNKQAEKRLELEHDLLNAIKEEQFELYYQPKVSSTDYRITGMEALIRWIHPEKGIISPADFIPVAEETGLINKIGEWVIREAMTQQSIWGNSAFDIVVAINISPVQFRNPELLALIRHYAQETKCNTRCIEFEITESLLLGDSNHVTELLDELSSEGYRIALDDFGTGYSNLAYLSDYPLTCLKIDQQFVMNIKQTAILSMVIKMGKMMNLKLVAEGVETVQQIAWLKQAQCDELQGYYFSKPLPASEATTFIKTYEFPSSDQVDFVERQLRKAA